MSRVVYLFGVSLSMTAAGGVQAEPLLHANTPRFAPLSSEFSTVQHMRSVTIEFPASDNVSANTHVREQTSSVKTGIRNPFVSPDYNGSEPLKEGQASDRKVNRVPLRYMGIWEDVRGRFAIVRMNNKPTMMLKKDDVIEPLGMKVIGYDSSVLRVRSTLRADSITSSIPRNEKGSADE